jgi:hypothetical protein
MKMKFSALLLFLLLLLPVNALAGNFEITKIEPIFNEKTPYFGAFKVNVDIKNNTNIHEKLVVSCFYSGFAKPGVYFKNEPTITKEYKIITLKPNETGQLVFGNGFVSYHPSALGEIIVSIAGESVVKSIPLKTRFHPESQD